MMKNTSRADEARAYHLLQKELVKLRESTQVLLLSNATASRAAASDLLSRAKALWERDKLYDISGWVRPLAKIDRVFEQGVRIFELGRTHPRTAAVDKEQFEGERELSTLSSELGVLEAIGNPNLHCIREIARAVDAGAAPTPDGRPDNWPWQSPWVTEPVPWDADWYVTLATEGYFTGDVMLAGLPESDLLGCALAVLMVLDQDRTAFEEFLETAGADGPIGECGKTQRLSDLRWEDCSPVRWWMTSRHYLRATEESVEPSEWALLSKWDLDRAAKELGEAVLDLTTTRTEYDAWVPAAMEILEVESVMVSELQRRLGTLNFPAGQKEREKLSEVLRGKLAWPGRARQVVLAESVRKRLVPVEGWRARVAEVFGGRPPHTRPRNSSPF